MVAQCDRLAANAGGRKPWVMREEGSRGDAEREEKKRRYSGLRQNRAYGEWRETKAVRPLQGQDARSLPSRSRFDGGWSSSVFPALLQP